jgi:hypothetical protein
MGVSQQVKRPMFTMHGVLMGHKSSLLRFIKHLFSYLRIEIGKS